MMMRKMMTIRWRTWRRWWRRTWRWRWWQNLPPAVLLWSIFLHYRLQGTQLDFGNRPFHFDQIFVMNSVERNSNEFLFLFSSFIPTKRGQHKLLYEHFWIWQMDPNVKTHANHKIHEMDHNEEHLGGKHMEYCDVFLIIGARTPFVTANTLKSKSEPRSHCIAWHYIAMDKKALNIAMF